MRKECLAFCLSPIAIRRDAKGKRKSAASILNAFSQFAVTPAVLPRLNDTVIPYNLRQRLPSHTLPAGK